jgi:hypothetical protein
MLAPLYGAKTTAALDFRWTCDIVFMITLIFGLLYLKIGDGWSAFKDTFAEKK